MIKQEDSQQQSAGEDTDPQQKASGNGNSGSADSDTSKIYLTDNSTLQTPEEYELDKHGNHHEDSQVTATDVEDSEPGIDDNTLAGSDLPGVSEK